MEEEIAHNKIIECENAVDAIERFLNIEGCTEHLESKKGKYKLDCINIPATIASYLLFFMITSDNLKKEHTLNVHYRLNITLLRHVFNDDYYKNMCITHIIDIIMTNGFSLEHGFVWNEKQYDNCSF
jgi:hypothetical protein